MRMIHRIVLVLVALASDAVGGAALAVQAQSGSYRPDWPQASFTVPMWLVQCTGQCPSDGLFLVSNPQAIPGGAVRILGGPYRHGGDLFLDRRRLLAGGLPGRTLRVEVLDPGGQRVDGLVLAEAAELGRMTAEAMGHAAAPRAPVPGAPQAQSGEVDDDVIRPLTPSEASRASERAVERYWRPDDSDDPEVIRSMTPSEASRAAEAHHRAEGPAAAGRPQQEPPVRGMTLSEVAQAMRAGPAYPWDTRIRVHGIECFGGRHIEVYFDHFHLNGRFVGVDRHAYDRVRAMWLASGEQFCGAWETSRETKTRAEVSAEGR